MSRTTVELDFFGMEKDSSSSSKSQFQKFLDRQRSFRGRFPLLFSFVFDLLGFWRYVFCVCAKRCFPLIFFFFSGMQSAISKINPEVLKSVIASGSANQGSEACNAIPSKNSVLVPSSPVLPVYTPPIVRYWIYSIKVPVFSSTIIFWFFYQKFEMATDSISGLVRRTFLIPPL